LAPDYQTLWRPSHSLPLFENLFVQAIEALIKQPSQLIGRRHEESLSAHSPLFSSAVQPVVVGGMATGSTGITELLGGFLDEDT
jgi:hypothetical protein